MSVSLLFAAPNRSMALGAERLKRKHGLEYTVFHQRGTTAERILEEAKKHRVEGIISRGGFTQTLRALQSDLPVADIPVTALDVIESLSRAFRVASRVACIGFENFTYNVPRALRFLRRSDCLVLTRSRLDDVDVLVRGALQLGVEAVVGDTRVCDVCRRLRLPNFQFCSGPDALLVAYDEAQNLIRARRLERIRFNQLEAVLTNIYSGVIVLDGRDDIVRLNPRACELLGVQAGYALGRALGEVLPELAELLDLSGESAQFGLPLAHGEGRLSLSRIPLLSLTGRLDGHVITIQLLNPHEPAGAQPEQARRKGHIAKYSFDDILGESPALARCKKIARQYAVADSPVFISGETGTGKELFAHGIHRASARAVFPFVAVNCAALPESLLESELFGYVRGAFTDARREGRVGIFEQAAGGTLFLDEITEIPPRLQARLLRAVQENEIVRIGDERVITVNVRVIAAGNKNPAVEMEPGRFRRDLFYRLNVLNLHIPPLRERGEDILPLARHFLKKHAARLQKPIWDFDPSAALLLAEYDWPGNVRELGALMERLVVVAERNILSHADVAEHLESDAGAPRAEAAKYPGRETLLAAYARHKGKRAHMAAELGMHRATLWRHLRRLCPELE